MAVGRERCNLNKRIFISCLQNNRQKHSSQAICVRATVQLFWHHSSIISSHILNSKYIQWNTTNSKLKIQFLVSTKSYVLWNWSAVYKKSAVAGLEVQFRWYWEDYKYILDFKISPCSKCCMLSSGLFPGVWVLCADVSEHSVCSIFIGR